MALLLLSWWLRILKLSLLELLLNLILLMLSSVKLGCLIFAGLVILRFLQIVFLVSSVTFLPQQDFLDLPRITGRDLQEVARAKKATAGGLDGWAWNEVKALPLPRFSGLAILLELVEPHGLLDAYIAMIPKADGDSAPLGQRPLSVLPVVYRLWASLRLGHLREWVEGSVCLQLR